MPEMPEFSIQRTAGEPEGSAGAKGRTKPPKATPKPYGRHILGIDSGVQSHHKATTKPSTWEYRATPKPPQCDPKATLRLHQGSTKAPPKPPRGEGRRQSTLRSAATEDGNAECRMAGKDTSMLRERAPAGLDTRTRRNRLAAMKPPRQHSPPAGTVMGRPFSLGLVLGLCLVADVSIVTGQERLI